MEMVCKENRRPFVWFYDENVFAYIRRDGGGVINGSIKGANLPDPFDILESRMRMKQKGVIPMDSRVEADPVTQKLWEHWHAKFNN